MFTVSGRERKGFADNGAPAKPFCRELPPVSTDIGDWQVFRSFIRDRGIDYRLAQANAWYPSREAGDDQLRVVIPGTSRDQTNQFWQARLIEDPNAPPYSGNVKRSGPEGPLEGRRAPRYQSPHAARGDALIVVHPELHPDGTEAEPAGSVLVEGPFDALAAAELGFVGVALMGNTPNEDVLDHAVGWLKAARPAMLVVDSDATVQGADLSWRLVARHGLTSLRILNPYPYKDLAEMPKPERSLRLL